MAAHFDCARVEQGGQMMTGGPTIHAMAARKKIRFMAWTVLMMLKQHPSTHSTQTVNNNIPTD